MAERAITYALLNDFSIDFGNAEINLGTDTFSMRLVTDIVTVATLTNASLTQVTGTNYTAGGIVLSTSVSGTAPIQTLESSTTISWVADATGFTGAVSAVLYSDTAGKAIAFSDIRKAGLAIDSTSDPVTISLENDSDLFTIGA